MRYLTDTQAQAIPSLQAATTDDARKQLLDDAAQVYSKVDAGAVSDDIGLRSWGEGVGLTPDRMNGALAFLAETGRLLTLPDTAVTPDPPVPAPAASKPARRTRR